MYFRMWYNGNDGMYVQLKMKLIFVCKHAKKKGRVIFDFVVVETMLKNQINFSNRQPTLNNISVRY